MSKSHVFPRGGGKKKKLIGAIIASMPQIVPRHSPGAGGEITVGKDSQGRLPRGKTQEGNQRLSALGK